MIRSVVLAGILLLVALIASAPASAGEGRLAVFDTGASSAEPLTGEAVASAAGWSRVEQKDYAFKGDAVLCTNRLAIVIRQKGSGAEVYGKSAEGSKLRGRLVPLGLGNPVTVGSVKVTACDRAAATVEATFKGAGREATVAFTLTPDSRIAKTEPRTGATGLRFEAPCRLGVMPDFFADDMVVDARTIPVDRTELPSEHFFMQMLAGGDSILTAVWDKNQKDVEITLAGEKDARQITGVEIPYEGGAIWAAALEQKGIWTSYEITPENVKNVATLEWKVPFHAKWKGDFVRADHTVDSWEFFYVNGPGWMGRPPRWRWSGVIGSYDWPCWFEKNKAGELKAGIQACTKFPNGTFAGPFVTYPIDRDSETPTEQAAVTDLMRGSLGGGPCEYIMDTAGAGVSDKGIFTCAVDAMIPALFSGGLQKEERVMIDRMLQESQTFVKAIGDRINVYVDLRSDLLKYLAEQKKVHPELADFIGRLEKQTNAMHGQKVDKSAVVARLVDQIKAEAMSDSPRRDIGALTVEEGNGIASHGGWQDDVVARCRNSVKIVRQIATIEMAINPKSAEVAREVRKRTQLALRGALGHEMR